MFVKYASAYVVLPGSFGTLVELAEILTLVQTGKTRTQGFQANPLQAPSIA